MRKILIKNYLAKKKPLKDINGLITTKNPDEQIKQAEILKEWIDLNFLYQTPSKIWELDIVGVKEHFKHLDILEDPKLFDKIIKEISKKVVGEKNTIKTIFLCTCGRLVKNSQMTSYNLLINSESSAGKDYVSSRTLEILPKEIYIKRTRITEKIFTYWHNPKFEPDWTWDGKVFYNEDISNNVLNGEVFKTFSSSSSHATVLINQRPCDIEIRGKPVMIVTTASSIPNKEIRGRYPIINLNETIDQTKAIMKRAGELAKSGTRIEYNPDLIDAQKFLKREEVVIPFADKLYTYLPAESIMMRRHFERFLDYIKASTVLYQKQRERDEKGRLIARGQDYDNGRIALLKSTSNPLMIPLTRKEEKILEIIEKLDKDDINNSWSVNELLKHITFFSDKHLRTILDKLTDYGFLKKDREQRENTKQEVTVYLFKNLMKIKIPKWSKLSFKVS